MTFAALQGSLDVVAAKIQAMNTDATSLSGKIDGVSQQFATLLSEYDALIGKRTKSEIAHAARGDGQQTKSETGDISTGQYNTANANLGSGHYDSAGRELSNAEWREASKRAKGKANMSEFQLQQQSEKQLAEMQNAALRGKSNQVESKVTYRFSESDIREISDRLDELGKRKS